jgi:hypothetical protein
MNSSVNLQELRRALTDRDEPTRRRAAWLALELGSDEATPLIPTRAAIVTSGHELCQPFTRWTAWALPRQRPRPSSQRRCTRRSRSSSGHARHDSSGGAPVRAPRRERSLPRKGPSVATLATASEGRGTSYLFTVNATCCVVDAARLTAWFVKLAVDAVKLAASATPSVVEASLTLHLSNGLGLDRRPAPLIRGRDAERRELGPVGRAKGLVERRDHAVDEGAGRSELPFERWEAPFGRREVPTLGACGRIRLQS